MAKANEIAIAASDTVISTDPMSRIGLRPTRSTSTIATMVTRTFVTDVMTPSEQEIAKARAVIGAFEAARQQGLDRVELDGHLVEVPSYTSALQLIARARSLAVI